VPTCWIIAGPNGAGKTTFAMLYLPAVAHCHNFINADLIAAGLSPLAPAQQQAAAGRLLLREVRSNVDRDSSFAVETTLAGRGYLKLVDELRNAGWHVELIYLALPDKAMSHRRVAERVAHGGHDIAAADIERRFGRSLRHLMNDFGPRVAMCRCFMNSGTVPELVFEQRGATRVIHHPAYYQALLLQAKP
jgi:predicted ABC-type ATPase